MWKTRLAASRGLCCGLGIATLSRALQAAYHCAVMSCWGMPWMPIKPKRMLYAAVAACGQDMHASITHARCQLSLTRFQKRGGGSPHEQETGQVGRVGGRHDRARAPVERGRQEREAGFVKQSPKQVRPAAAAPHIRPSAQARCMFAANIVPSAQHEYCHAMHASSTLYFPVCTIFKNCTPSPSQHPGRCAGACLT